MKVRANSKKKDHNYWPTNWLKYMSQSFTFRSIYFKWTDICTVVNQTKYAMVSIVKT